MPPKITKWMKITLQLLLLVILMAIPLTYSSRGHRKLGAEYLVRHEDTGIAGVTNVYQARLSNRGFLPAQVQVCAYVDDTGHQGRIPAFSIEQFDADKRVWLTILDVSSASYCRPYPLGWNAAATKTIWLWPGHFVQTGEEATGARGYLKGALLRFVLYDSFGDAQTRKGFMTESFVIDEQIEGSPDAARVTH